VAVVLELLVHAVDVLANQLNELPLRERGGLIWVRRLRAFPGFSESEMIPIFSGV